MPLIKQSTIDTLIKTAVENAETIAAKKVTALEGTHAKEIFEIKNKTAREISDLTSLKDTAEFKTKQANEKINVLEQAKTKSEELLNAIQEKLKYTTKTKVVEQTLPTGNKLIRKANKNGAKMTLEVTAEGKKVSCTVETLDGMVKKTTYDPTTGKPLTSFSTSSGKARQQKYKNGNLVEDIEINVKKPKTEKPYALNNAKKVEIDGQWVTTTVPYSDGSKVKKMALSTTGEICEETFYNEKGNWTKFVSNKGDYVETLIENDSHRGNDINLKYKNGTITDIIHKQNELGVEQMIQTTRYPKTADTQIKVQKQTYCRDGRFNVLVKEERTLKNGDLVTIKVNPREQKSQGNADMVHNYKVDSIEITPKKGEKIVLAREDALNYLKEQGIPHTPMHNCNDKTMKHAYV